MISAKINVMNIDKSKLFPGKNGAKYLDIVLIETENDRYGNDFVVVQGVSKEERAAGVKGSILGNAKSFEKRAGNAPVKAAKPAEDNGDNSVPF